MDVDREIDTRGLNCPLPILKAKKSLNDMASGQLLRVVSTDPGSVRDFQRHTAQFTPCLAQTVGGWSHV